MNVPTKYRRIRGLLTGGALLANCLFLWGCPGPPAYPAVVYDVPRCYDNAKAVNPKDCKDSSKDLYLNFDYLAKSDVILWMDITGILKNGTTKYWKLNVFRSSTGEYQDGTYQEDKKTDWLPVSEKTVRLKKLPLEVLLRADFEFCSSDNCEDKSAKIVERHISFVMHEYPEKI